MSDVYITAMDETQYCLCCGEDVRFNRIKRNQRIEQTCIYCGFLLSYQDEPLEIVNKPAVQTVPDISRYALIAEDSKFTRNVIKDLLIKNNMADVVMDFENGLELTSAFAKLLHEKKPMEISIIVDISMPVMDGFSAARTIRGIEAQSGVPPIPIIFFSAIKADDNLRNKMRILAPAYYMNKSSDSDPDKLAERVEQLLSYLTQVRTRQGPV